MKIIDLLTEEIRASAEYNASSQVAPSVILWTDKQRQWEPALPALQAAMPELIVLGDYAPAKKTGPAIWVKCVIEGVLPDVQLLEDKTPILYLPGIERRDLRAIASCPEGLMPLAELQYRGCWWAYNNSMRDWTVNAFLVSKNGGLGLDVAGDINTQSAMLRALTEILSSKCSDLHGRRLEASDFNRLVTNDPARDLLTWMNDPQGTRKQWGEERWLALVGVCETEYKFSPEKEGELAAAELLCQKQGVWGKIWRRYLESWDLYPNLVELLMRVKADLAADGSSYPIINQNEERTLESQLNELVALSSAEVRKQLIALEQKHHKRREWVWYEQGLAPLAGVLEPLAKVATLTQQAYSGGKPSDMAQQYRETYWQADDNFLRALASPMPLALQPLIHKLLSIIYTPWLEEVTRNFQEAVRMKGYPGKTEVNEAIENYQISGEVVFFVDGLRYDVAQRLLALLKPLGTTKLSSNWAALPTVTATAKAAITPVHDRLTGRISDVDFTPSLEEQETGFSAYYLKKFLAEKGWQYLNDNESGDPTGNAWVQTGDIDSEGHARGIKLAAHIDNLLNDIVERTEELLAAGWRKVRYVTDHGWLLTAEPMKKVELAKHLTETRWGRCASIKSDVSTGFVEVPWHWSKEVSIAMAPGVACFRAGQYYDHGGLSLQECVTPIIELVNDNPVRAQPSASVTLAEPSWMGMRCRVQAEVEGEGKLYAVLRTEPANSETEISTRKPLKNGRCSLVVADDDREGSPAVLVVIDEQNNVIARKPVIVGEE